MPLPSLSPTRAPYGADDDAAPAFSILLSMGVTLTERYWVTSGERRSSGVARVSFRAREFTENILFGVLTCDQGRVRRMFGVSIADRIH